MYISYQGLQAIHDERVNDFLRRSERRQMRQAQEKETDSRARTWNPGIVLTALVRSMLGVMARP